MLTNILIIVAVLVIAFMVIVALQPKTFRVQRSATISAPPPAVFSQVNDLHNWETWSPWAKLDPTMKTTYEGSASGKGAISSWSGTKKVGEGRMTIVESRPHDLIRIKLEFFRPFKATSTAEFTFKPEGGQTVVTWSMFGENNFLAKAFHMFMNCDKMIGGDFEKGLAS